MAELKTQPTTASVADFLNAIPDVQRRADCQALVVLMQDVTGSPPVMWGDSIVGFGRYRYTYASGRSGEWPITGFSPRKQDLTLYLMSGFEQNGELLARLGKHKIGKSCLYLKRLSDADPAVLRELVPQSVAHMAPSRVDTPGEG